MSEVFGIIAPHPPIIVETVGGARSRVTADSLQALHDEATALTAFDPDTLVVMSPHAPAFGDAFAVDASPRYEGSLAQFGDRARRTHTGDPDLALALIGELEERGIPAVDREDIPRAGAGQLDHGVLVPLNFLDPKGRWPLVVLSLSGLPYDAHRELGDALRTAAERLHRRVAFVASGDCSHRLTADGPYGLSPEGPVLDSLIVDAVTRGEFGALSHLDHTTVEEGAECGLRSFIALGGFAGDDPVPTRVLAYEGPWGVGYLSALVGASAVALAPQPAAGAKGGSPGEVESEPVALARRTIETYLRDRTVLEPEPLTDPALPARAGAFVSLHRNDALRGCIGTIGPTRPTLAEEIVGNAIQAATGDPRFPSMTAAELNDLDIKVDVLHEPEPVTSLDELDPKVYGVIVARGNRRGLLLPDLEGVDDADTQVAIASQKAGIMAGEPVHLERFKVDRYS